MKHKYYNTLQHPVTKYKDEGNFTLKMEAARSSKTSITYLTSLHDVTV
jgi:hypothetical protein